MKHLGHAATFIGIVALVLCIVGVAIPYWEHHKSLGFEVHSGLWEICGEFSRPDLYLQSSKICIQRDGRLSTHSMKAVRALEILGTILLGFSLLSAVLKLCVKKDMLVLFKLAGGLAIFSGGLNSGISLYFFLFMPVSGLLMIIGTIIYGCKTEHEVDPYDKLYLHAGFGLCVTSGCFSVIIGVLYCCDRKREHGRHRRTPDPYPVVYMSGHTSGTPGVVLSVANHNNYAPPPYSQYYMPPPYAEPPPDVKYPST